MNSFTQIKLTFPKKRPVKLRWLRKHVVLTVCIYMQIKQFDIDLFFLSIWLKKIIYSFYLVIRLSDIENL